MSTTPSNLPDSSAGTSDFNVAPAADPGGEQMQNFNSLQNWAPQAMQALRRSNLKTQMMNPQATSVPQSGMLKGLIASSIAGGGGAAGGGSAIPFF